MAFKYMWFYHDVLFVGPTACEWDWAHYDRLIEHLTAEIKSKPHDVYVIIELNEREALPPNPIANMNRLVHNGWPPGNIALMIALCPSAVAQLFLQVFTLIHFPVEITHSLEDALKRVGDHRNGHR